MSMGLFALLLKYLTVWQAALAAFIALVHNAWIMPRWWGHRVYRKKEVERGLPVGILVYPFSVLLLILIFGKWMFIPAGAWAIMAFGDGLAGFFGTLLGRHRWPWNPAKSLEGSIGFLIGGTVGAWALIRWTVGQNIPEPWAPWPPLLFFVGVPLLATALTMIIESLPLKLDDNFTVPISAGLFLYIIYHSRLVPLVMNVEPLWLVYAGGINLIPAIVFYSLGWVDRSGFLAGFVVGWLILGFGGWVPYGILFAFFFIGSLATKMGKQTKIQRGIAETGQRGWHNVVAKGGWQALAMVWLVLAPESLKPAIALAFITGFVTAIMDTVSSEIGKWIGKRTFIWWSLRSVPPGTEGAISLEGTLAGLIAGTVLAVPGLYFWPGLHFSMQRVVTILILAFGANLIESVLGYGLQRRDLATNEEVNALLVLLSMIGAFLIFA